jgi:hypothetical protein
MKTLIGLIAILALSGFAQDSLNAGAAQAPQFYLHFLTPAVGEQANGGQARPYLQSLTTKISLGKDFEVREDGGMKYISGRIEDRSGKIYAHLFSHYASNTYYDDRFVEAEKKYHAVKNGVGFSGAIFQSYFVVSTNADCKPFILANAEPFADSTDTSRIAGSAYRTIVSTNTGQYTVVDSQNEVVSLYDKSDHLVWKTNVVMGMQADPVNGERKISGLRVYQGDLWVNVGRGYGVVDIKTGRLKGVANN